MTARLVFVGGGPKTTGLLLALAAAARADRAAFPERLEILVVDPFPAGGGRIWRHAQSPTLWMNSLAEDVTIFPDEGAEFPSLSGPSLAEWAAGRDLEHLGAPAAGLRGTDFAPRRIQAEYLGWAYARAQQELPDGFVLETVRGRALAAEPLGDRHIVSYEEYGTGHPHDSAHPRGPAAPGGAGTPRYQTVLADALVLAQGFLEVADDAETAELREQASRSGLGYTAPGYTADVDLSGLPAGEDVLVRGLGLAFVDAMMMLTEDRGGRFERVAGADGSADGPVVYHPSGREPVLWAGSGRGVPYKSKLGHRPEGLRIGPTRWLTADTVRGLCGADGTVDCETVLFPLLEAELAHAHYAELATRYEGRTTASAEEYGRLFADWHRAFVAGEPVTAQRCRAEWIRFAEWTVPDPADRFDLSGLDRPFAGASFASQEEFEAEVAWHTRAEIDRAADARYSQDAAVFFALVSAYYVTRELVGQGVFTSADRIRNVDGRFHGLFSYIASGPPPERLENLLALHRAGIVRFLGADVRVRVDAGDPAFVATSGAHPDEVRARWLVDARLAPVSAARATDTLLRGLLEDGHLLLEDSGGGAAKLVADADCRAVRPDGGTQRSLFLVGPSVAGGVAEAFTRPGIDGRVFRENARMVRSLQHVLSPQRASTAAPYA
ncbi:FAD/NAD(P)-binding protein [Brevibacterium salitolerans]|uniref:FAD/NAD(P)-binding protein n=1 Tax=Brevibacterium salitolerans TaxID=1403566 RepID=A0ABP5INM8_9MICO